MLGYAVCVCVAYNGMSAGMRLVSVFGMCLSVSLCVSVPSSVVCECGCSYMSILDSYFFFLFLFLLPFSFRFFSRFFGFLVCVDTKLFEHKSTECVINSVFFSSASFVDVVSNIMR